MSNSNLGACAMATPADIDRYEREAYAEGRKDECEECERRTARLFVERAHLREQNARLLDVLCGIHGLLPSPPIETSDGKTYVFQDPNANETLRALRIRIAGIEEAVAAIRNAQFTAKRKPELGVTEHDRLMKFYAVDSLAALVDAQAHHIEKLQAKLPQAPSFAPQRVREG